MIYVEWDTPERPEEPEIKVVKKEEPKEDKTIPAYILAKRNKVLNITTPAVNMTNHTNHTNNTNNTNKTLVHHNIAFKSNSTSTNAEAALEIIHKREEEKKKKEFADNHLNKIAWHKKGSHYHAKRVHSHHRNRHLADSKGNATHDSHASNGTHASTSAHGNATAHPKNKTKVVHDEK